MSHFKICFKQNKIFLTFFYLFFWHFFNPSYHRNYKSYRSNYFKMSWHWKFGLWTCIFSLYLWSKAFFWGEDVGRPPQSIHQFRPPSLSRVNNGYLRIFNDNFLFVSKFGPRWKKQTSKTYHNSFSCNFKQKSPLNCIIHPFIPFLHEWLKISTFFHLFLKPTVC